MAETLTILGIDTSLRSTGYGVVRAKGSSLTALAYDRIHNKAKLPRSACVLNIHRTLSGVIAEYQPTAAAMEGIFVSRNAKTSMILGEARGAVLCACAAAGLPLFEYSPRRVKQAIVGSGGATKDQIGAMIRTLLGLPEPPQEDAADALALAVCHIHLLPRAAGLPATEPI